jgi:radical SAM protein with 4Fe4S-binding SPASM domain
MAQVDAAIEKRFRSGRPVTAYFKPSDFCNVGCDHCYLPAAVRANKTRMTDETLDRAIQAVRDMVERQRAPGALIVWHGGEPLVLPRGWFANACARVRELTPSAIQSIQTSLIPYRSEWAPILHDYMEGEVGSSIDFSQRTIQGNVDAYQDLWMKKVELARRDGLLVTPGVVPSKGEMGRGREIVTWMLERGFMTWNIDRYNSFAGHDPNRPTNAEHSAFLVEVFDAVMDLAVQGTFMKVNTVSSGIGGVLFDAPGDRWGGSCSRDFIVINPDGSANACPDKISFESFSNINDGFDAFEGSDGRKAWIRTHLTGHRNPDCPTCPFNTFCRSGCPLTPNAPETEGECSGYHRYLRHVQAFSRHDPSTLRNYLRGASKR